MEQTTLLKRPWGAHPFQTCSSRPRPAGGRWMRPACAASQREGPSTAAAASRRQLLGTALLAAPLLLPAAGQAAEAFMSSEGFAFQHPTDWVVAFDRSGGRGDGAVTVSAVGPRKNGAPAVRHAAAHPVPCLFLGCPVALLPPSHSKTASLDQATPLAPATCRWWATSGPLTPSRCSAPTCLPWRGWTQPGG